MSTSSAPHSSSRSISSRAGSRAKTSRSQERRRGSSAVTALGSGESSAASSARSGLGLSSSRTSRTRGDRGCPSCGATSDRSGTPACLYACAPRTLAPHTSAHESSSSPLPTLTATSYGTNRGGASGRVGEERASLQTLARGGRLPTLVASASANRTQRRAPSEDDGRAHGRHLLAEVLLPTLTVRGNYNRKGASPASGDGLATAVGGRLNPTWLEWFMGYPPGWTDVPAAPAKPRSATRSFRRRPSGSAGDSSV